MPSASGKMPPETNFRREGTLRTRGFVFREPSVRRRDGGMFFRSISESVCRRIEGIRFFDNKIGKTEEKGFFRGLSRPALRCRRGRALFVRLRNGGRRGRFAMRKRRWRSAMDGTEALQAVGCRPPDENFRSESLAFAPVRAASLRQAARSPGDGTRFSGMGTDRPGPYIIRTCRRGRSSDAPGGDAASQSPSRSPSSS